MQHVPPSVARVMQWSTAFTTDAGFPSLGLGLAAGPAVADSAVVRSLHASILHRNYCFF
jgi:hypothetical protein